MLKYTDITQNTYVQSSSLVYNFTQPNEEGSFMLMLENVLLDNLTLQNFTTS
jgi:hypothetical protein